MTDQWLTITYRDFYDIPRAFVVENGGTLYFFDCPFDDNIDDYPDRFLVYKLSERMKDKLDTTSWAGLSSSSQLVGTIPVNQVQFDASKRGSIRAAVFDHIAAT